jgi:hypothetical protein
LENVWKSHLVLMAFWELATLCTERRDCKEDLPPTVFCVAMAVHIWFSFSWSGRC